MSASVASQSHASPASTVGLHRRDVILLRPDETPNLIDLKALALQALEHAVLIPGGGMARVHNELADRRLTHAGQRVTARIDIPSHRRWTILARSLRDNLFMFVRVAKDFLFVKHC